MAPPSSHRRRRRRLRRFGVTLTVLAIVAVGAVVVWHRAGPGATGCTVTAGTDHYELDTEQAANAATVAATADRLGLPHHAVTVALAAALQESKLRNLPYGDRDSLGLFQQRPSQGWGTPAQLMDPAYASGAFLQGLEKVRGWETMSLADAAQSVQRSASADAYAGWEDQARALARALTGEVPAALTCRFDKPVSTATAEHLRNRMQVEFGSALHNDASRWTVATWLVAHSYTSGVTAVTYDGQTWTYASGAWKHGAGVDGASPDRVAVRLGDATTLQV
ncbi:MAG TPA: hypothetical protein VFJ21_04975 [Mycobacteriales bacterium]|jgi:hypothetical protein|nr:hypothetical protein [Mycobacteriales bacterium]